MKCFCLWCVLILNRLCYFWHLFFTLLIDWWRWQYNRKWRRPSVIHTNRLICWANSLKEFIICFFFSLIFFFFYCMWIFHEQIEVFPHLYRLENLCHALDTIWKQIHINNYNCPWNTDQPNIYRMQKEILHYFIENAMYFVIRNWTLVHIEQPINEISFNWLSPFSRKNSLIRDFFFFSFTINFCFFMNFKKKCIWLSLSIICLLLFSIKMEHTIYVYFVVHEFFSHFNNLQTI